MDDHEAFYDEEIAPTLMELVKACEARGIPFLASVEYAPGKLARTEFLPTDTSIGQRIATWAARADANVDALWIAIERHARQHGHSSAVLSMRGVPASPASVEHGEAQGK